MCSDKRGRPRRRPRKLHAAWRARRHGPTTSGGAGASAGRVAQGADRTPWRGHKLASETAPLGGRAHACLDGPTAPLGRALRTARGHPHGLRHPGMRPRLPEPKQAFLLGALSRCWPERWLPSAMRSRPPALPRPARARASQQRWRGGPTRPIPDWPLRPGGLNTVGLGVGRPVCHHGGAGRDGGERGRPSQAMSCRRSSRRERDPLRRLLVASSPMSRAAAASAWKPGPDAASAPGASLSYAGPQFLVGCGAGVQPSCKWRALIWTLALRRPRTSIRGCSAAGRLRT